VRQQEDTMSGIGSEDAKTESRSAIPDEPQLQRVPPGPDREGFLPLLLLADEPEPLRGYLQSGELYALKASDGEALGVTLVLPYADEPETAELKAVAVAQSRHNRGLGRRMLAGVLADLQNRGWRRVVVGTSNAGIGQVAFYQKAGFRLWRIERDYFTPEKGYDPDERENGLPHRDMVWFDQDLP
jgi:ribosomal protein S18 acetylase RimI-like enzyme